MLVFGGCFCPIPSMTHHQNGEVVRARKLYSLATVRQ
jgi:hypothetical protein